MPLPRRVTTVPGWVPAGTSICSSPSSVGTLTLVPSAAAGAGRRPPRPGRCRRAGSARPRHPHQHVEVAGRAAALAGVAAAAQPDALLVGDPRRHVDLERLARRAAPAPAALGAGLAGHLALAAADVAGLGAHQLAERRRVTRSGAGRCRRSAGRSRSACRARRRCRGSARTPRPRRRTPRPSRPARPPPARSRPPPRRRRPAPPAARRPRRRTGRRRRRRRRCRRTSRTRAPASA